MTISLSKNSFKTKGNKMKKVYTIFALGVASTAIAASSMDYQNLDSQRYNQSNIQQDAQNWNVQDQNRQFFYSQDADSNQGQQYYQTSNANQASQAGTSASSDKEIAEKIHDEISEGWISKGYPNISFGVHNGNVTLKGSVDSQANKDKLEQSVRKIDGVRQITNQVIVEGKQTADNWNNRQNSYYSANQAQSNATQYNTQTNPAYGDTKNTQDFAATSSDRELNKKIRDKLSGTFFSSGFETLTLNTRNGNVTITGTVKSADDIQKIQDKLNGVKGIQSLNNQIVVSNK